MKKEAMYLNANKECYMGEFGEINKMGKIL